MYDSSNFQRSTRSPFRSMASYVCHVISELGSLPCTSCSRTCSVALVRRNPAFQLCDQSTALQLKRLDVFGFLAKGLERKDGPVKWSCSLYQFISLLYNNIILTYSNIHSSCQVFGMFCGVCNWASGCLEYQVCLVYSMLLTTTDLEFSLATNNLTKNVPHVQLGFLLVVSCCQISLASPFGSRATFVHPFFSVRV